MNAVYCTVVTRDILKQKVMINNFATNEQIKCCINTSIITNPMLWTLESPKNIKMFGVKSDNDRRWCIWSKHWTTSRARYLCKRQPFFVHPVTISKFSLSSTDWHTLLSAKQLDTLETTINIVMWITSALADMLETRLYCYGISFRLNGLLR